MELKLAKIPNKLTNGNKARKTIFLNELPHKDSSNNKVHEYATCKFDLGFKKLMRIILTDNLSFNLKSVVNIYVALTI